MKKPLRILIVEDNPADAKLVLAELRAFGFEPAWKRVETEAEFLREITLSPEIILSDYSMPEFSGLRAAELLQASGLDIPFILISGTVGEDVAVEAMRYGATDYLLKDRIARLGSAVERALRESQARRESKAGAAALVSLQNQLRRTLEFSPAVVYSLKVEGARVTLQIVNENITRLLGFTVEECMSTDWWAGRLHPEERESQFANVPLTLERDTFTCEYRVRHKSGHYVWLEDHRRTVRDAAGHPVEISGVWIDITERKRTEAELRWKTALLEAQVDSALDGILVVDKEGKQILQNQRMSDLWKIPPHIANDKNDAVQLEFVTKQAKNPRQFLERVSFLYSHPDEISRDEIELMDGTILDRYSAPVRDKAGSHYGRIWTFRDITERKRMEASHARLAMSVEQASENVVITDTRGTILYANPAFEKTTGYTVAEALGKNPRILKSGKHDAAFYEQMWGALRRGEVWRGRITNRRKDGALYEEEATISSMRDDSGKVVNYVAVKRDVTREVQLEAQLLQSQKMEGIGQLAGGIAHDFNNILAAIMMQAELTGMVENLPGDAQEGLVALRASAERAANLTHQLLLFSRKEVMQSRQLDLNEIVTSLAKMLRRIVREDARLELHLHSSPLLIFADAGMLDQVLMNLVVNARDAMPNGGWIIIETTEEVISAGEAELNPEASVGRYARLSVSDTGCGMTLEIQARIFEPFFTTKEVGKGTGLGLATVFGIVKQHKGWVEVCSEVGKGSTFRVFLPATDAPAEAGPAKGKTALKSPGGSETILVAEDNEQVRMLTRVVLERHGYKVLEASDGVEAQKIWAEHQDRVALLLTDLIMPGGVDGRELAARLQSQRPELKVIFTSGYSADIAGRELKLKAGQKFIQKPCPPHQLLQMIRDCLDG